MRTILPGTTLRPAVLAWAAVAALTSGCEEAPRGPQIRVAQHADTPVGRLQAVMDRLESALDRARPAPQSGVASVRSCSYKFVGASDSSPPTATIAIETRVKLSESALPKPPNGKKGGGANTAPLGQPAAPEPIETADRNEYRLEFRDGKWALTEPLSPDTPQSEATCLDFALADQALPRR
ncbi:MAG TPA: hypothetical protein VEQ85_15080 [Lacipirellulaceae bacterium]|nr:hypothetical protein [Lacipirellulaceae bacterium]